MLAAFLSILLAGVTTGVLGLIISTALIVVFAEIVPQSICCRYGLVIGARLAVVIQFFMIVLAPLSYPLAWILDKVSTLIRSCLTLGRGPIITKPAARALMDLHCAACLRNLILIFQCTC